MRDHFNVFLGVYVCILGYFPLIYIALAAICDC